MARDVHMKRRKVQELKKMCYNVISKNFRRIISRPGAERDVALFKKCSQAFLSALVEENHYAPFGVAKFCLNSYLKKLDFSWFDTSDFPSVISELNKVETTLLVLKAHHFFFPEDLSWNLARSTPTSLKSLTIPHCTDALFRHVVERCPDLVSLDVHNSNALSNFGLESLWKDAESGNTCRTSELEKVNLIGTSVTGDGVRLALQYLPNLKKLCVSEPTGFLNLSRIIYEMYHNSPVSGELTTYKLTSIKVIRSSVPHCDVLQTLSVACPLIMELSVDIVSQSELNACINFTKLRIVDFLFSEPCDLLPFLKERGKSLTVLKIRTLRSNHVNSDRFLKLESLSADILVKFCQHLVYLHLFHVQLAEPKPFGANDSQYTLPYLEVLFVQDVFGRSLEEFLIFLIARSRNLQEIKFMNSKTVFRSSTFAGSLINCISTSTLNELSMSGVHIDIGKLKDAMSNFACV